MYLTIVLCKRLPYKAVMFNRMFCDDGTVQYLHCPTRYLLVRYSVMENIHFKFYLILIHIMKWSLVASGYHIGQYSYQVYHF